MKIKCRMCYGHGKYLKEGGFTAADVIPCLRCNGTGLQLPDQSPPRTEAHKRTQKNGKHLKKNEGMHLLKFVEEV